MFLKDFRGNVQNDIYKIFAETLNIVNAINDNLIKWNCYNDKSNEQIIFCTETISRSIIFITSTIVAYRNDNK